MSRSVLRQALAAGATVIQETCLHTDFCFSPHRGQAYTYGKDHSGERQIHHISGPGIHTRRRRPHMLMYALICLSLALLGIAGLQFTYLFYLDKVDKERKRLIIKLEAECRRLSGRLSEAEAKLADQEERLFKFRAESGEELWADIIDER